MTEDTVGPSLPSSARFAFSDIQPLRVPSAVLGLSPDSSEWRVSSGARNVKQNLAPRGGLLAAHKRPPFDSTMERLICSPIPVPFVLVVKNALNILSACCDGSPTPVSLTEIST